MQLQMNSWRWSLGAGCKGTPLLFDSGGPFWHVGYGGRVRQHSASHEGRVPCHSQAMLPCLQRGVFSGLAKDLHGPMAFTERCFSAYMQVTYLPAPLLG